MHKTAKELVGEIVGSNEHEPETVSLVLRVEKGIKDELLALAAKNKKRSVSAVASMIFQWFFSQVDSSAARDDAFDQLGAANE